jgi:hypothetical protein
MKIAVAFFGIPRNSKICLPTIESNIYGRLPGDATVASFYHLYSPQMVTNVRSGEHGFLGEDNYQPFDGMKGVVEPAGGCLDRWDYRLIQSFGDVWGDDGKSLHNLVHQLNSLHEVTSMLEAFGPDVVLFLRPDLIYLDPLPKYVIPAVFASPSAVHIPHWQWWNGLNDRFAVCGRSSYRAYGKRIECALRFCAEHQRGLHSERLLRFAMKEARAKLRTLDMRASRVRVGGEVVDESFSPVRSMGRRENRFALPVARFRACIDKLKYSQTTG